MNRISKTMYPGKLPTFCFFLFFSEIDQVILIMTYGVTIL